MPFKTGLGTAGTKTFALWPQPALFQCPLRRAWVLRVEVKILRDLHERVSMPFKTGLGTAGEKVKKDDPPPVDVSMPFKTGLGTAGKEFIMKKLSMLACFNAL